MKIEKVIKFLKGKIENPRIGLPEEIFLFISEITPLVNVELLIKDENQKTLLSWRDDKYCGSGWHIPGGVVRFKETLEKRVQKVAETEIGTKIEFEPVPIAMNQIICDYETRGHGISILYKCFLLNKYILKNTGLAEGDRGYLKWHDSCPKNLIKLHEIYRKIIQETSYGNK